MSEYSILHKKLKFSWAHIIAFIAMIATTYFAFAGTVYLTGGNFTTGYIVAGVSFIALFAVFFFAQQLKGASGNFKRSLRWERVLVIAAIPMFLAIMIPVCHFWTVESHSGEISSKFSDAINSSKAIFTDYENFSEKRIKNYDEALTEVISDTLRAGKLSDYGFNSFASTGVQKANMEKVLELKLLSDNYKTLKKEANGWIDGASQGVSAWNVFLLGNTRQIKEAARGWETLLVEMSERGMKNDRALNLGFISFSGESQGADNAFNNLAEVENAFTEFSFPSLISLLIALLLLAMLSLPYVVQRRDNKFGYTGMLPFGKISSPADDNFATRRSHHESTREEPTQENEKERSKEKETVPPPVFPEFHNNASKKEKEKPEDDPFREF